MFVSVASEHLPQGPTRPLNKGLLVGANWARGLERTSQLERLGFGCLDLFCLRRTSDDRGRDYAIARARRVARLAPRRGSRARAPSSRHAS